MSARDKSRIDTKSLPAKTLWDIILRPSLGLKRRAYNFSPRALSQKPRQLIIAATSDLFIQSRLKELSDLLGQETLFTIDPQKILSQAASHPECLIILDLATSEYDSPSLARTLKQNNHTIRILGYYPHVRTELEREAKGAGVDYVVPNSRFLTTVREILEGRLPHS